jgi:hypothetical protein
MEAAKWKASGHGVKHIHTDNAGENLTLEELSDSSDWKLGINFEYTAQNTPQHKVIWQSKDSLISRI